MEHFEITSDFQLTGDQPQAVELLVDGLIKGFPRQTLLGVTGSGKTFTVANVIARIGRPALVLSHNKTLAAQLYSELKEFFPKNAVEYFVSYYDYYQPEAYVPAKDMYIEKDADINEEIDKLRHAATKALLERRDVIIVASVSCIYGLGEPEEYRNFVYSLVKDQPYPRGDVLKKLVEMQYERNDVEFTRGRFRVRGDTLDIQPSYEEMALKFEFFGDTLERISSFDPLTGELFSELKHVDIFPAKHFVTSRDKLHTAVSAIREELEQRLSVLKEEGKILEAARLEARTNYDIEMMLEAGYCSGIENYSRHLSARTAGSAPWTLLDYFPKDFIAFIDESHMSLPQIRGMFNGDFQRKKTLVDFGFRLPSAIDNRPLTFNEFNQRVRQTVFVSATPAAYEIANSSQIVEQLVRPTGLLEPSIEIKPTKNQIDDLFEQIQKRVANGSRCLITTLTKKLAEKLADYLAEIGIKSHYLHSEMDTFERVEVLRDLRLGVYDVVVGINLLREGLDLPEVSLVAILDADKEGYLRSEHALIQTMGRAARHVDGHVIMYADTITNSMRKAIEEIDRRRAIQTKYNQAHGVTPQSITKAIKDISERIRHTNDADSNYATPTQNNDHSLSAEEKRRLVDSLEKQMKKEAKNLNFEKATLLRDRILNIRRSMLTSS